MSGGKCVAPSKRNRQGRACRRYVRMRGSLTHSDVAGRDSLRFTGRLAGRKLPLGTYRLEATPATRGRVGTTVTVLFSIL
jgi:hypothetical protein